MVLGYGMIMYKHIVPCMIGGLFVWVFGGGGVVWGCCCISTCRGIIVVRFILFYCGMIYAYYRSKRSCCIWIGWVFVEMFFEGEWMDESFFVSGRWFGLVLARALCHA